MTDEPGWMGVGEMKLFSVCQPKYFIDPSKMIHHLFLRDGTRRYFKGACGIEYYFARALKKRRGSLRVSRKMSFVPTKLAVERQLAKLEMLYIDD